MSDWRHEAACVGYDGELWFPVGTSGPVVEMQTAAAKQICRTCPVRETCLEYALTNGLDAGVFGGLSENERRTLKRGRVRGAA